MRADAPAQAASSATLAEAARSGGAARRRLVMLFAGVAVIVVVFAALATGALRSLRSHTVEIADDHLPSVLVVEDLREAVHEHRGLVLIHVFTYDVPGMRSLEEAMASRATKVERRLAEYEPLLSDRTDAQFLESASAGWREYRAAAAAALEPSRTNDVEATRAVLEARTRPAFERLDDLLDDWTAFNAAAADTRLAAAERTYRTGLAVVGVALVVIFGALLGAAALARRAIGTAEQQTSGLLQSALEESTQATVFQRLADRLAFATGEADLVDAAQATLRRLVASDRGDLILFNPSRDRLSVGAAWGPDSPEVGALVDSKPSECPGIRRGAVYETPDLADDLAVRCRAHPGAAGTLLCVPMIALGETVGVVHLERTEPFDDAEVRLAGRTAEHASLALANARLLRTMENLAMTDSLTGLQNARFFDPLLDHELAASARDRASVSVLMVDLDNFKRLNDTYGHPAGDEVLRAFARILRSTLRESDAAARYGGEEFAVMLRGDEEAGLLVAEKLRAAVEHTPVDVGPGRVVRVTTSIGVATTAQAGYDRLDLLRLADRALYRAKQGGRNAVVMADLQLDAGPPESEPPQPDADGGTIPHANSVDSRIE